MKPSATQLEKMARHIWYDLFMLDVAYKFYGETKQLTSPHWALALECFLLHARILRDFFLRHSRSHDDVMACDYFDEPNAWWVAVGTPNTVFERLRERMDKQLAHLSLKRADYLDEEYDWRSNDLAELYNAIRELNTRFHNSLPQTRRRWFEAPPG